MKGAALEDTAAASLCLTGQGEGELLTAVPGERMRQEAQVEIKVVRLGSTYRRSF